MAKMKAAARQKVSREQYEEALMAYVANDNLALDLATDRDRELEPINNKYDPQFEKLRKANEELFPIIQQYCEDNREDLFAEKKSVEEFGAEVGFREGKDKVIILEGFKEKEIVAVMQKRKAMEPYVRMTPSMDKAAIIKDKPKGTEKLGFYVGREETFYVEPVKTEA